MESDTRRFSREFGHGWLFKGKGVFGKIRDSVALLRQIPHYSIPDAFYQNSNLIVRGIHSSEEFQFALGIKIHAVGKEAVRMHVQVNGTTKSLNKGNGPGFPVNPLSSGALHDKV